MAAWLTVHCTFPILVSYYELKVLSLHLTAPQVDGSGVHVTGGGHWGVCGQGCPRDPRCPQGWTELDTGCYKLMEDTRVTKPEAEEACQSAGGYIVEIESREELDALNTWYKASVETQCMFDSDIIWLGIHNETNFSDGADNVWKSDRTGEPVSFKYWLDSEPNYGEDNERCAGFFPNRCKQTDKQSFHHNAADF